MIRGSRESGQDKPSVGLLARSFGITAPFWFAFAGSAALVVVLWWQFGHIAHDDAL